jgi:hypothetical protein
MVRPAACLTYFKGFLFFEADLGVHSPEWTVAGDAGVRGTSTYILSVIKFIYKYKFI